MPRGLVPLAGRPRRHRQIDPVPAAGRLAARPGYAVTTCVDPGGTAARRRAARDRPAPPPRDDAGLRGVAVHGQPGAARRRGHPARPRRGPGRRLRPLPARQCRLPGPRGRPRRGAALAGRPPVDGRPGARPDPRPRPAAGAGRVAARPARGPHGEPGRRTITTASATAFSPRRGGGRSASASSTPSQAVEAVQQTICQVVRAYWRREAPMAWQRVRGMTPWSRRSAAPSRAAGWRTPTSSPARPASASACSPSSWPRRCCAKRRRRGALLKPATAAPPASRSTPARIPTSSPRAGPKTSTNFPSS